MESKTEFPVVSLPKFTLLFFATAGLYYLFWFYNCWRAYERETNRKVFCVGRTLFAVFFVHELFAQIEARNQQTAKPYKWSRVNKAWIFIFGGIFQFFIYGLTDANMWPKYTLTLIVSFIATCIQYYALYTVQLVINRNAGDPFGVTNARFTLGSRVAILFGLYCWFNICYVVYLEQTDQLPEPPVAEQTLPSDSTVNNPKGDLVQ